MSVAWCGLLGLALTGCVTVNAQSAIRLSDDAILSTRALSRSLDETRRSIETLVEGQALSGPLLGTAALPKETLCSLQSVQRSLRLRITLLEKLITVYDHFIGLAHEDFSDAGGGVYDNLISEISRADYVLDPKLVQGCPSEDALPTPDPAKPVTLPAAEQPSGWLGFSQSKSLQLASERIRAALDKLIKLLEHERPIYESLERQVERSRTGIARAMLVKFGTVSPGEVFAPQLESLGLRWDEREFQKQLAGWPADKQQAMRSAILAVVERRSQRELQTQIAQRDQHLLLLRALYRQHQLLEAGQPLDLRIVAALLEPLLKSVNLNRCQGL